jgi:hypothetical protein
LQAILSAADADPKCDSIPDATHPKDSGAARDQSDALGWLLSYG